jgi:hypothetical protein
VVARLRALAIGTFAIANPSLRAQLKNRRPVPKSASW